MTAMGLPKLAYAEVTAAGLSFLLGAVGVVYVAFIGWSCSSSMRCTATPFVCESTPEVCHGFMEEVALGTGLTILGLALMWFLSPLALALIHVVWRVRPAAFLMLVLTILQVLSLASVGLASITFWPVPFTVVATILAFKVGKG